MDEPRFLAAAPALPVSDERRVVAGTASCRIEVTGIDGLYRHRLALGVVHPNAPLADQPWGMREFAILDPDHNLITLYQQQVQA